MSEPRTDPEPLSGEAFHSIDEALEAINRPPVNYLLNESQRQMILLAIAHLAIERPGWDAALAEIAYQFRGCVMFEKFKKLAG